MRLWHIDLIDALPKNQLVAQWRELSAIAGAILKNNTPNHLLVNFVMNYPFDHFISYAKLVREEMTKRGYRTMNSVWDKIISLKHDYVILPKEKIFNFEMNKEYLTVCYYNLYEKYLRGGISEKDMLQITNKIKYERNDKEILL